MKNSKFIAGGIAVLMGMTFFAGCAEKGVEPTKSPEEVINEAMKKTAEVQSYRYDLTLNGEMEVLAMMEDGKKPGVGKFNVSMKGLVDSKDTDDLKFAMDMSGSLSDGESSGSAVGEVKLNKDAVYFNVKSVDTGLPDPLPEEFTSMFGKWWKITLPEEAMEELSTSIPKGGDENLTPEEKELKKAFEDANFFLEPKYVGIEDVKGQSSWRYSVKVDKDALIDFSKKAAEINDEDYNQADFDKAKAELENVDISGDVWVSKETGVFTKIAGEMSMEVEGESGKTALSLTLWDIGKALSVDVHADAEEFPIEDILGPLMMLGGGGALVPPGGDAIMLDGSSLPMDLDGMPLDPSILEL